MKLSIRGPSAAAAGVAFFGSLMVPAVSVAAPSCFGQVATIVGTTASETIDGTPGPDVIVGGGGSDRINGLGGDDRICAPSGDGHTSVLRGGGGNDRIRGAAALFGGTANDLLVVAGTIGSTVFLDGGPGNDTLRAPVLKAHFVPGPGLDTVVGNSAVNDELSYEGAATGVVVDLATGIATGQGRDTVSAVEQVLGSSHADTLLGNGVLNVLSGFGGDDVVSGRGGDDVLRGDSGADRINGGPGSDACDGTAVDTRTSCEFRLG